MEPEQKRVTHWRVANRQSVIVRHEQMSEKLGTHQVGSERIESPKAQPIVGRKWPGAAGARLNWSND